ncbi:helix-turn-helix domain-containing protein [Microbacterium sp. NPDC076911]|uniref:TetR/AcrR family transcriptional regulator n=1 Tax=Microbacterium sp. NPDC076911 TaxID=3154958 RepID=UPI00341DCD43
MSESMASPSRRREATRQKLLDAAAQVFAEVGLDAASVEEVCERAGFTRGAFYSNFDSKDELFLELAARVSLSRVEVVRARVRELECDGSLTATPANALLIIEQVLDTTASDRLAVLLMSEIRINALRNPALATAYLAQESELLESVTQIVDDIAAAKTLAFTLPARDAARVMLTAWESASVRAVMAGLSQAQMREAVSTELAIAAHLVIQSPQN